VGTDIRAVVVGLLVIAAILLGLFNSSVLGMYQNRSTSQAGVIHDQGSFGAPPGGSLKPYLYPAATSPVGGLVLVKEKTDDAFALQIFKGDRSLARLVLYSNPWELQWNPSGTAVAFFAESINRPGIYELHIWSIASSGATVAVGPPTRNASYGIKWSPDGKYLSYVVRGRNQSNLAILEIRGLGTRVEQVIKDIIPEAGGAWSPDSKQVAFVAFGSAESNLTLLDLRQHRLRPLTRISTIDAKDLNWSPSIDTLALALRDDGEERFHLLLVSIRGATKECREKERDLESPVWLNERGDMEYIVTSDSRESAYRANRCRNPVEIYRPFSGGGRLQNDGYTHKSAIFIAEETDGPPRLASSMPIRRKHNEQPRTPYQLWLSINGRKVPAWFWPNVGESSNGRAIVLVHGGPHLHESGGWDPLKQAFIDQGFTVLAVNYSGSSGYGRRYEEANELDNQAADLIASIHFLSTSQRIPPAQITIFAASYGTQIAILATKLEPSLCGLLVLNSLTARGPSGATPSPSPFVGRVIAFQGVRDTLTNPAKAYAFFQKTFPSATSYWRQFQDEGHAISRISSLREEFGTILCATDLKSCAGLSKR